MSEADKNVLYRKTFEDTIVQVSSTDYPQPEPDDNGRVMFIETYASNRHEFRYGVMGRMLQAQGDGACELKLVLPPKIAFIGRPNPPWP